MAFGDLVSLFLLHLSPSLLWCARCQEHLTTLERQCHIHQIHFSVKLSSLYSRFNQKKMNIDREARKHCWKSTLCTCAEAKRVTGKLQCFAMHHVQRCWSPFRWSLAFLFSPWNSATQFDFTSMRTMFSFRSLARHVADAVCTFHSLINFISCSP